MEIEGLCIGGHYDGQIHRWEDHGCGYAHVRIPSPFRTIQQHMSDVVNDVHHTVVQRYRHDTIHCSRAGARIHVWLYGEMTCLDAIEALVKGYRRAA